MKKVLIAAVMALVCCAPEAWAQGGKVRFGPLADDPPANEGSASKSDHKKSAPPRAEAATENRSEKTNATNGTPKNDLRSVSTEEKADPGKKSVALSSAASPVGENPSAATSDAPPKTTSGVNAPPVATTKNDPAPSDKSTKNATPKGAATLPKATASPAKNAASPPKTNTNANATSPATPASNDKAKPDNSKAHKEDAKATSTSPASLNDASAAASKPDDKVPAPSETDANTSTPPKTTNAAASTINAAASAATAALAPTAIYRVGVGDVLDVRLLNQTNMRESTLYTVMAGGLLEYPLAGDPLNVSGLTPEEIAVQLASALKRRAVYDKPQLVVSVREYESHSVLVSGLVGVPGAKILRREAVPLYVVIAEAQPHPDAGRAVIISRATGQSTSIDLADTSALGALVGAGDVINVLPRQKEYIYIGGEIADGGQKDFHAGLTLTQAVMAAGGVTRASSGRIKVARQGADGRLVSTEYSLLEIESGKIPDPRVQPGDRIEVARKR